MRGVLLPAVRALVAMTLLAGVAYPLLVTGVARLGWAEAADGSLVHHADGSPAGSAWVAQPVTDPGLFDPRPSAVDHDGTRTGGSNLGPSNPELLAAVAQRVADYRARNDLAADQTVPVDAVTASGSGWDPHISPANAALQAPRVAAARGLPVAEVAGLVEAHTQRPPLWLGPAVVNVVTLNLALDRR